MFPKSTLFFTSLVLVLLTGCHHVGIQPKVIFDEPDEVEEDVVIEDVETKQSEMNTVKVSDDTADTSDWLTYRNEELGFEFRYPKDWDLSGAKFNSFAPVFKQENIQLMVDTLPNQKQLSVEEWIDKTDFFGLKKLEDQDSAYRAYGINDKGNIEAGDHKIYYYLGRASGGGSFGTALFVLNDKVIVVAYSFVPSFDSNIDFNNQIGSENDSFIDILKSLQTKQERG